MSYRLKEPNQTDREEKLSTTEQKISVPLKITLDTEPLAIKFESEMPEVVSAFLNQAWLVQEFKNCISEKNNLPIKYKNDLNELQDLSSIQKDLAEEITHYDEKRYSPKNTKILNNELTEKLLIEKQTIELIINNNLFAFRQLYFKYQDTLEKINNKIETEPREHIEKRLKDQFIEAIRGLKNIPSIAISQKDLGQINSVLKEFSDKKELEKKNLRLDQTEKIIQQENAWAYVREKAQALGLNEFLQLDKNDFEDTRSKITWRNRFLIALMALSFSGSPKVEIYELGLEALKEKISWLKSKGEGIFDPNETLSSDAPDSYEPTTGGTRGDSRPLNIHPDSALTRDDDFTGKLFAQGLYLGEGKEFNRLDLAVKNEVQKDAPTFSVIIEPQGKNHFTIPTSFDVGLNPNFKMNDITVEQYLGRVQIEIDGSLEDQKTILLKDILIKLNKPEFTLTKEAPAEITEPKLAGGEVIIEALNNFPALRNQNLEFFNLIPEAQERMTKIRTILTETQQIWRRSDFSLADKANSILKIIQNFVTGPDFLYSNNPNEQASDQALMEKLNLSDQTIVNIIKGKMDCDMGAKMGLYIYNASIVMAKNNGIKFDPVPPVATLAIGYKNDLWSLEKISDSPNSFGIIQAETAHGILALLELQGQKITVNSFDLTPTDKDSEMSQSEKDENIEKQKMESFMEKLSFLLTLPEKVENDFNERSNHITYINLAVNSNIQLIKKLQPLEKARVLELVYKQIKYLKSLSDFCRHNEKATEADFSNRTDLIEYLHKFALGLRSEAYDIIEAEIISELKDSRTLARYLQIQFKNNIENYSSYFKDMFCHNEYWSEWPESSKDLPYRQRDHYIANAFKIFDAVNKPSEKKLAFLLKNSGIAGINRSETAQIIEDCVWKNYQEIKTSIPETKKDNLYKYFDGFIDRMTKTESMNKKNIKIIVRYAKELLNEKNVQPQTPTTVAKMIINKYEPTNSLISFNKKTSLNYDNNYKLATLNNFSNTFTYLEGTFFRNIRLWHESAKDTSVHGNFRKLNFEDKQELINIFMALACDMSPVYYEDYLNLNKGLINYYEINPTKKDNHTTLVINKNEGLAPKENASYIGIINALLGIDENIKDAKKFTPIGRGGVGKAPPTPLIPAEKPSNSVYGIYANKNQEALKYISNFFTSKDGREYLNQLAKEIEAVLAPKYSDIKVPPNNLIGNEHSANKNTAETIVDIALKKYLTSEKQSEINPRARQDLIDIIAKQIQKNKILTEEKEKKPIKDW